MEFIGIKSLSELIEKKAEFKDILNQGLQMISPEYAQAANAGWVNADTAGKAWDTFKTEGLGAAQKAIQDEGKGNAMKGVAEDVWKAITTPQQSATSADPMANYVEAFKSGGMNSVTAYMKQNNIPLPKDMKAFENQIKTKIYGFSE